MDDLESRQWSNGQLKKLGKWIRDGGDAPAGVPEYDEVMLWYSDLADVIQQRIGELDWEPLLRDRVPEVTGRAKTIDTLRQKLQRNAHSYLPTIQDIAGARFEAEMSLDEQDAVAEAIAAMFGAHAEIKDLRDGSHSGYRAIHVWLRFPAGRAEVQIRTHLQGHWANTYELAADLFGREIRYGHIPADGPVRIVVETLHRLSQYAARIEVGRRDQETVTRRLGELQTTLSRVPDPQRSEIEGELAKLIRRSDDTRARRAALENRYAGMLSSLEETLQLVIQERG